MVKYAGVVLTPLYPPKELTCPLKMDYFNKKYIFQPFFLRAIAVVGEYEMAIFSSSKSSS